MDVASAAQKEEPIAGVEQLHLPTGRGKEGECRIDPGRRRRDRRHGQADEVPGRAAAVGAGEEEARQRVREPAAVGRVGDEGAPGTRDALEAAERLGRQPREDLDDELVREDSRRRRRRPAAPFLHPDERGAAEPAIHAAARLVRVGGSRMGSLRILYHHRDSARIEMEKSIACSPLVRR